MRQSVVGRLVGSRVARVEDHRLLTGHGTYVDDVRVAGVAHAAFLRSPHPHARIAAIDTSAAERVPGVLGVFTGADLQAMTNPFMSMVALDGLYDPMFWALATDRVRFMGDPVVLVVARTRDIAEDACELVAIDYEPLSPIATTRHALDPTRPPIWPGARSNVMYRASETFGDVDGAFASADRVVHERFVQHRISNQPMETRGCLAEIDPATGEVVYHAATQSAHLLKWMLGLLVGTQPAWRSLLDLARQPGRVRRFARAAREFVKVNESALAASRGTTPVMVRQFVREPRRLVALNRALLGLLAKDPARIPRVVARDIGGAFGAKGLVAREDVAVLAAAVHLGRSVKWIEDRNEHLLAGGQAREEALDVDAAVLDDGTVLGFRVRMMMDQGAYPGYPVSAVLFARMVRTMFPGPYRIPALAFDTTITASNKATYVPYRGPWAAETWVRERMLDVIARELGMSRGEIRLRNLFDEPELPTVMATGPELDIRMTARRTLETALELSGAAHWDDEQRRARAQGRCVGLGLATFIEPAPGPPRYFDHVMPGMSVMAVEPSRVLLEADGTVTVITQQVPHGQGHETTLAQVAADELGVPLTAVRVHSGDTGITPFGLGTGGSRSAKLAGGSVTYAARELRDKILDHAANLLEAAPDDLQITDGTVHVRGVPSVSVSLDDVASVAARAGAPLTARHDYDGGEGGWSCATHVCWVEVDLATGRVHVPRYLVVEDCGELINPTVV
ncbi:MAG TPA: xanthine dehydrogenase family protein molybdopterin-binding subunit, partial [Acidimicrobiales bacterium]|nr:xanthine dehydrogenase family protein molybdopterin-binding subunit [Acidimicrobiales bacterium]